MSVASTLFTLQSVDQVVDWLRARVPTTGTLRTDSRQVQPGDAFIAWPGGVSDGRAFVADAVARGAVACVVEREGAEPFAWEGLPVVALPALKAASGPIAAQWFAHPSRQLDVIAITGTNGKTSTSWWLAQAIGHLAERGVLAHRGSALVGTLGVGVPPDQLVSTGMTTPDPVLLQQELRHFADQGLGACVMEASSIGIEEHRLDGTQIRVAVFTNFTQDHLDYHGSMEAYWHAKRALFAWPGLQSAVVHLDDAKGVELAAELSASALDLWTTSAAGAEARLTAHGIRMAEQGLAFEVQEGAQRLELHSQVIGQYNVGNLLQVIASLRALGVGLQDAVAACQALAPVPGRMEQVTAPGAPLVAIDYSHTPDALEKALAALRPMAEQRGGQLWCVFGCGGNRDAGKRPLMGGIAQRLADRVIVTSDNPRHEEPLAIIAQIEAGMSAGDAWHTQPDRALAIAEAIGQAQPDDVILLAGKGHEDYQEIRGARHPFLDMAQAQAALQRRKNPA
ncbi:MAG: UDP-N-acetylmuramoyl-L-alanyl-D-glutamate--2,6-diaminopimelate ligase [Comamonas sp.]